MRVTIGTGLEQQLHSLTATCQILNEYILMKSRMWIRVEIIVTTAGGPNERVPFVHVFHV